MLRRKRDTSVAIVSNEFFDHDLGRMGGFGWAARQSAACFASNGRLRAPLFLAGAGELAGRKPFRSLGVPLVPFERTAGYERRLRRARIDAVLSIDYRPGFRPVLEAVPEAPLVVWIRDPRTPEDLERVATLELPGSSETPSGLARFDLSSLAEIVARRDDAGLRTVLATTAPTLARRRVRATYGLAGEPALLPNPLDPVENVLPRSERPRVIFLGRLDPIKRPWIFVQIARRLPQVEFVLLGGSYQPGPGGWALEAPPDNLRLLGHVDGAEKTRFLASSWLLVNSSIHESLPVSFLESLHCGTPVVSCQDPEGVASRFGAYVGRWDGSGEDGVDAFVEAVGSLLEDGARREELGEVGRAWARRTHTRERFLATFDELVEAH